MNKLLTVKEFDEITYKKEFGNNKCKVIEYGNEQKGKETFDELINFIHDFSADKDHVDALELMNISYKRGLETSVKIKNYVGLIELKNHYKIEILPKILLSNNDDDSKDEEEDKKKTRKLFLKMLRTLHNFNSKTFNNANLDYSNMDIYEVFINIYISEVKSLIRHGLKSSYITKESDNLNTVKGKILLNEQFQYNYLHKERFYCRYDEYLQDRSENRIIKSTLLKFLSVSSSYQNIKEINQVLPYFEMVSPSLNYEYDFSHFNITRDMDYYTFLLDWSKVFLKNNSFSTFSGSTNSKALLFKMDKLFEAYVAKMIKKQADSSWDISLQDKKYYLIDKPSKKFMLRPDIVMSRDDITIILDTKWKELNLKDDNYGISSNDMYQMCAYARKYNTPYIWLLYPMTSEIKNSPYKDGICFESRIDDLNKVFINAFFVDIEKIETSIDSLLNNIKKI